MMAHIAAAEKKSNILERQLNQVRLPTQVPSSHQPSSVHDVAAVCSCC